MTADDHLSRVRGSRRNVLHEEDKPSESSISGHRCIHAVHHEMEPARLRWDNADVQRLSACRPRVRRLSPGHFWGIAATRAAAGPLLVEQTLWDY